MLTRIEPILAALLRRQVKPKTDAWENTAKPRLRRKPRSRALAATSHDWLRSFDVTARESEIASLILQGHSNTSIGQVLEISGETVKVHRKHLYSKLSISAPAELFHLFIERIKQR